VTSPPPGTPDGGGRTLPFLAQQPVGVLHGVGPRRQEALGELGIESVLDLLTHYPRRYIDRTRERAVAEIAAGEEALVLATVRSVRSRRTRQGRALVELDVGDDTGVVRVVFFNQGWRAKQLPVGSEALFFGSTVAYRGRAQLTNPVVDLVGSAGTRTGRIVPVYPSSEKAGITSWDIAGWVSEALERAGHFADPLPATWRERLALASRGEAFEGIHRPTSFDERDLARRRLAFDELLRLQLELVMRRHALERDALGIRHVVEPAFGAEGLVDRFLRALPFDLTAAQRHAVDDITRDMAGSLPMHRLLQGDVGAGKTVVALAALLVAVQGGHQGALMAPTEVLAEQHLMSLRALLGDLSVPDPSTLQGERPLRTVLLTSKTGAAARARLVIDLAAGGVDIVVGTHALLTEGVGFASLGAVVIDEQHRFGVDQRAALRAKGRLGGGADPDLLVMTATPIPRTAAMVVFGDLDMTVVDELPVGRKPVTTLWARTPLEEEEAWARVRQEVADGGRAYVVCPLVEGSERVVAKSATQESERLAGSVLADLRLGLLHGQMRSRDKEAVMDAFRRGDIEVLVATTVIEVGVDVPEATVMVVEDAARFGIAQLHQLRGRVGRSDRPSWCYLLGDAAGTEARTRLEALEQSTDGFALADVDMALRGEGTILGTRQKGRSDLKLATLRAEDRELLAEARACAESLLAEDAYLQGLPQLADETRLFLGEDEAGYLFKS
jgi:ATP-dependent DNA helicase RecG